MSKAPPVPPNQRAQHDPRPNAERAVGAREFDASSVTAATPTRVSKLTCVKTRPGLETSRTADRGAQLTQRRSLGRSRRQPRGPEQAEAESHRERFGRCRPLQPTQQGVGRAGRPVSTTPMTGRKRDLEANDGEPGKE